MNASIYGVTCPDCGESVEVRAEILPGEPMQTSGPPESWYPGSGPELADWKVTDWNCVCRKTRAQVGTSKGLVAYDAEIEFQVQRRFDLHNFEIDELERDI